MLGETEIPYVALDLDGDTVRRESRHGVPIYYGDGANANVLRHMRIDDAKVLGGDLRSFTARRTVQAAKG
ncbi:MAG: NAD-binding protein [Nitrospiraceae bacterium]